MRRAALLCLALAVTCKVRVPTDGGDGENDFPCETSDTCPVPDSACLLSACMDGTCVFVPAPNGVLPEEEQVIGDCKQLYCDGDGEAFAYAAQVDLPQDDGNPCTEAVCDLDIPKIEPKVAGTTCAAPGAEEGMCNGNGKCGVCLPEDKRCDGHGIAQCNADGQWGEALACATDKPVCASGACIGVVEIDSGADHMCARFDDGTVRCWGNKNRGQLGEVGSGRRWAAPRANGFSSMRASHRHRCGIRRDRTVWCSGYGELGQLGHGARSPSAGPVATGVKAVSLDVGDDHACAVTSSGAVSCWGRNDFGQLGSGKAPPTPLNGPVPAEGRLRQAMPALIPGLSDAKSLDLDGARTCVMRENGKLQCWGLRFETVPIVMPPPVPDGEEPPAIPKEILAASRDKPGNVNGIADAIAIGCGAHHCCVRRRTGGVSCWGSGKHGQLATGGEGNSFRAIPIAGVSDVRDIGVGRHFACALRKDGAVLCWGNNKRGQLGTGLKVPYDKAKVIATLGKARTLAVGDEHACALLESGELSCWGDNRAGQLGNIGMAKADGPGSVTWP